ncbi:MAG: ATP-binding protein [Muribaculaceae bacterium]
MILRCCRRATEAVSGCRDCALLGVVCCCVSFYSHGGQGVARTFASIGFDGEARVVNCFAQDAEGMMWIGTNSGLCSFDGYNTYSRSTSDVNTRSQVNSITIVGDTIYIGADCGLLTYDMARDCYCGSATAPTDIRALAVNGDKLLVGSLKGFYEYDLKSHEVTECSKGLSNRTIYSILRIEGEGIYVGTYNGLNKYQPQSKEFRQIEMPTPNVKKNTFVNSMLYDERRGCVWIGTEGSLYTMDLLTHRFSRIDGIGNNSIKSLALDSRTGNVMVGTDNGLYECGERGIERYSHNSRIGLTLVNNIVWSVFMDSDYNLWAGTDYNISMSQQSSNNIIPIAELTGKDDGNVIYAMTKDSHGLLWMGGANGIIRFDGNAAHTVWYTMDNPHHSLPHNRVRAIYCDHANELWIAGDGSVNRYDYATQQFRRYHIVSSDHRFNANWAYSIFDDRRGNMWVGSFLGGVFVVNRAKLQPEGGEVVADRHITFGESGNFVNQMIAAEDGGAWVLLYRGGGLYKVDGRTYDVKRVEVEKEMGYQPSQIIGTPDGHLWCANDDKIAIYDTHSLKCLKALSVSQYVTSRVTAMAQAGDKVWLATNTGVWTIDARSYEAKRLNLPNHPYYSIGYDEAAQKVVLGGLDEIVEVHLSDLGDREREKDVVVTALYVNDELYADGEQSVRKLHSIKLGHDQNHIIICVSDFNYSTDSKTQFAYNIAELGDKWVTLPVNSNRISCANLAPGTYTVRVKAIGNDGNLTEKECLMELRIMPPWYASMPALIVYGLLVVALVVWIINFFRVKNRLRIARIEKEKTVEQIALKSELLANMSHELKTPLSLIIGPIGRLIPEVNDPAVEKHLTMAYENALKMNTLIHKVLDTKRIDADTETLMILSQVDMVHFCHNIVQTFETAYEQKHFIFTTDVETLYMDIDVVKMESVINNIISNACKYAGENATIAVAMERQEDNVVIRISDDGMGIAPDDIPFIFQRLYQSPRTKGVNEGTGIGLYIAKQFVELHGGRISVASLPGSGATFTIVLPIKSAGEAPAARDGSESDKRAKKGTILIVEDNDAIRRFLTDTLGEEYNCLVAANGRAGLAVCGSVTPDVMIIDYMMPVMDGMEMCRRVKENKVLACVPIIILTAKDDPDLELRSAELGVDCFMPKPFNVQVLQSRVRQLLGNKDLLRSRVRMEEITEVKEPDVESSDERMLAETVKLIEDHIDDPDLSVNYVSEKLGISPKQLYRKLKQHLGVTPVDFIKQVRMKKAAMLIEQNKFTISEIMYMVGFSSSSYFAKCFQAHFGKTPRQYAEEHREQP